MKIWKHQLHDEILNSVFLPSESLVVHFAEQHGNLCMWFSVDDFDEGTRRRDFKVVKTGEKFTGTYLKTAVMANGLVFHLIEA